MNHFTRIFKAIFVVVSIFLGTVSISAADFVVDGIYYNILSAEDKTCAVTFAGDTYSSVADEYEGDVIIPTNVQFNGIEYTITTIQRYAFGLCKNLSKINLPNSIISIERAAFTSCTNLFELVIPEKIKLITNGLCLNCTSLENIILPEGVETIEESAFNKTSISFITLPSSTQKIGKSVFNNCANLTKIQVLAKEPPTIETNTFNEKQLATITLEVPEESLSKYKIDTYWRNFSNIIKFDISTGVDISLTEESDIVEYYNILGVKVENPTKGLYIKKCGGRAYKVML